MNVADSPVHVILCNGATIPQTNENSKTLRLEYEQNNGFIEPNIKVALQRFTRDVNHLPDRVKDLLEIAAYVFCADRSFKRGNKDAVEYHAWSRRFHFFISNRSDVV